MIFLTSTTIYILERMKMAKASARHILVDSEDQCASLKQQIEDGADFAEVAKEHSSCPSGRSGGDSGRIWTRANGKRI